MKREKRLPMRVFPLLMIFVLLTVMFTSAVAARYIYRSEDVANSFRPAESANPSIEQDGNSNGDEEESEESQGIYVKVEDKGYPVYVRVTIVVTWQKVENGETIVHYTQPKENEDYELKLKLLPGEEDSDTDTDSDEPAEASETDTDGDSEAGGWTKKVVNGLTYYFYTKPVESGGKTSVLIESYELKKEAKPPEEGYTLNVEVIAQTVQAIGTTDDDEKDAYKDAWGIS